MNTKEETTLLVQKLSTLSEDQLEAFLEQTVARFSAILQNHRQGPLDDPDNPEAIPDPGIDPRNIFLTVLMLDRTVFVHHLTGRFAGFINGKWLMAMDVFVDLLPLNASAETLREGLAGTTLTQMISAALIHYPDALSEDVALLRRTLHDMFSSGERKLYYLTQFYHLCT